jgi:hypothetical protein
MKVIIQGIFINVGKRIKEKILMIVTVTYILIDLLIAFIFAIMGILFIKSNGKGSNYLAGYNMASTKERKNYDEVKLCIYTGKTLIVWCCFFIVGAIIDVFIAGVGVIVAVILFLAHLVYYSVYIRWLKFDQLFKIPK